MMKQFLRGLLLTSVMITAFYSLSDDSSDEKAMVMQCSCFEDDWLFNDYMGSVQVVQLIEEDTKYIGDAPSAIDKAYFAASKMCKDLFRSQGKDFVTRGDMILTKGCMGEIIDADDMDSYPSGQVN